MVNEFLERLQREEGFPLRVRQRLRDQLEKTGTISKETILEILEEGDSNDNGEDD